MTHPLLLSVEDFVDAVDKIVNNAIGDEYTDEEVCAIMARHELNLDNNKVAIKEASVYDYYELDGDWEAAEAMDFSGDPFYGQELDFND